MDGARSLGSGHLHPFHRTSANLLCLEETQKFLRTHVHVPAYRQAGVIRVGSLHLSRYFLDFF